jgi:hypothetical protein
MPLGGRCSPAIQPVHIAAQQKHHICEQHRSGSAAQDPQGQGFYKIPCSVDDLRIKRMLMAAYLPETSPIATPDQIILVLGDFPGDVWLDHGVILVATLGCDRLRSSGVATHMGEERIATIR